MLETIVSRICLTWGKRKLCNKETINMEGFSSRKGVRLEATKEV